MPKPPFKSPARSSDRSTAVLLFCLVLVLVAICTLVLVPHWSLGNVQASILANKNWYLALLVGAVAAVVVWPFLDRKH